MGAHCAWDAEARFESDIFNQHEQICDPYSKHIGRKQTCHVCNTVQIRERWVMNKKEKQEMTRIMICKKNEHEAKRFWGAQKRLFTIPLSEKQNIIATRGFGLDA